MFRPLLLLLTIALLAAGAAPTNPPWPAGRDEKLAAWIPRYPLDWGADHNAHRAARARAQDSIVYRPFTRGFKGSSGPADGLYFWHGEAGPPKGRVVIDRQHHIAFANEGCCSWGQQTLAYYDSPPPSGRAIPERDLSTVHTALGVALGMRVDDVRRRVGGAPLRAMPGTSYQELSYEVMDPPPAPPAHAECGEQMHYLFRNGHVRAISFTQAC